MNDHTTAAQGVGIYGVADADGVDVVVIADGPYCGLDVGRAHVDERWRVFDVGLVEHFGS